MHILVTFALFYTGLWLFYRAWQEWEQDCTEREYRDFQERLARRRDERK